VCKYIHVETDRPTDRQTDRQTELQKEADSRVIKETHD
jgi:hypothetical protein